MAISQEHACSDTVSTSRPPRVSVVIPSYNYARFLPQRLDSVFAQTYDDFEVILLDDASTDGSAEIVAGYASNARVRAVVLNAANSGSVFKQWNRGVSLARGDYVWIAEADDYADPKLLRTLVDVLDRNPGVGLAYCQSYTVDADGKVLGTELSLTDSIDRVRWRADFVANGREECRKYLVRRCTVPNASAVVFRRSLYQKIGGASERLRQTGDWLTWAKMAMQSDIAFVAEPLNFFRKHDTLTRTTVWKTGQMIGEFYYVMSYIANRVAAEPTALAEAQASMRGVWLAPQFFHRWGYRRHLCNLWWAVRFDPGVALPFVTVARRRLADDLRRTAAGLKRRLRMLAATVRGG